MFAALSLLLVLPALCVGRYVDRLYPPYVGMTGIYPGGLSYRSVHGWGDKYGSWLNPLTKYDALRRVNAKSYSPLSNMFLRNLLEQSYKHKYGGLDSTYHGMLFDKDFTSLDTSLYGDKYRSYDTKIMPDVPMLTLGMKLKLMTIMSFKKMDMNNDGFISKPELQEKFFGSIWGVKTPITKIDIERMVDVVSFDPQTKRVLLTHFDDLDKDKNGVLDSVDTEVIFDEIDIDRDFKVSEHEYKRFLAKQVHHIPALTLGMKINILISRSFKKMDINGDGLVSKPEMESKLFDKDFDVSGHIFKDEYEEWVEADNPEILTKMILKHHYDDLDKDTNGVLDSRDIDFIFFETDADKDGLVTEDEYKRYIVKQIFRIPDVSLGMNVKVLPSQWFKKMDVSGDGRVSKAEITEKLWEKDLNKDGLVTRDEFDRWVDLHLLDPQTKLILKDQFDVTDKNNNGVLDINDIDALFVEANMDGDLHISEDEYKKYFAKSLYSIPSASLGLKVEVMTEYSFRKIDANGDSLISKPEFIERLHMKDDNMDGYMSRDEYERWVDIEHTDPTVKLIVKKHFDDWDLDKNGFLEMSDIDGLFNYADTNKDGFISEVEFRRYVSTESECITGYPTLMDMSSIIPLSFTTSDVNGDGLVSKSEMESTLFDKDFDKNGVVTRVEYDSWVDAQPLDPQTKRALMQHFDNMDKDNNGVLDRGDVHVIFYQTDLDRDNHISEIEFEKYPGSMLGNVLKQRC